MRMRFTIIMLFVLSCLSYAAEQQPKMPLAPQEDPYAATRTGITQFGNVYRELLTSYVDKVDNADLLKASIDGMLVEARSLHRLHGKKTKRKNWM